MFAHGIVPTVFADVALSKAAQAGAEVVGRDDLAAPPAEPGLA